MNNNKVTVVDALCGSGKTSWIINQMNKENKRWIYVAPYLDEVNRIIKACPKRSFKQPKTYQEQGKKITKSEDLFRLVQSGANIASTHELFKRLTEETTNMLRTQNYCLVLDEILEIVEPVRLKPTTTKLMFDKGFLLKEDIEGSNTDRIKRVVAGEDDGLESILMRGDKGLVSFNHLKRWADNDRLVWINDSMLLWLMPATIFDAFDEIYILTYLFDGSYQKTYYDLHGIDFDYKSVVKDGNYRLIDYDPDDDVAKRAELRSRINVYDGKLNGIGDSYTAMSVSWWTKKGYKGQREDIMRKTLYNYLTNILRSNKELAMWTCFDANKRHMKPNGYVTCWIPFNQRATNLYRGKQDLAFLVNRFINPMINNYFQAFGYNVNEGMYALSELAQWLFRSGLRDGKSVNLYLPSLRMRHLLIAWLNDSIEATGYVEAL
jgi:hypothetical protein